MRLLHACKVISDSFSLFLRAVHLLFLLSMHRTCMPAEERMSLEGRGAQCSHVRDAVGLSGGRAVGGTAASMHDNDASKFNEVVSSTSSLHIQLFSRCHHVEIFQNSYCTYVPTPPTPPTPPSYGYIHTQAYKAQMGQHDDFLVRTLLCTGNNLRRFSWTRCLYLTLLLLPQATGSKKKNSPPI
jgi:hypothetical protein